MRGFKRQVMELQSPFWFFFVVKDNKKKWTSITKSDHNLLLDFSTIIDMLQTAGTKYIYIYIYQNSKFLSLGHLES